MASSSILNQTGRFSADSGYWMAIGCGGALILANTNAAPIAAGILGVALIYQLNQLLQGK